MRGREGPSPHAGMAPHTVKLKLVLCRVHRAFRDFTWLQGTDSGASGVCSTTGRERASLNIPEETEVSIRVTSVMTNDTNIRIILW